jgi:hypothetical protein
VKGIAPILKVIEIINVRESVLKEITELASKSDTNERKVDELEQMLLKLR